MPTLAEMAVEREQQDSNMILLIHQGKTARQIAEMLGLTASTIRNRAERVGLKCEQVQRRGPVPTRTEYTARPCHHKAAECKSMPCMGHRFGADLICQCGTDWHQHQRNGVPCEIGLSAECMETETSKTCLHGHDISEPDSVYVYSSGKKECRICRAERTLRCKQQKAEKQQEKKDERTHCVNGHPWTDVYENPNGRGQCRVCRRSYQAQHTKRRREKRG